MEERRELISGDDRIRRSFAAEEKRVQKQEEAITTFRGALTRSLILPGLGQYYRGQKLKGGIFMGAFAFLVWNYSQTRADYNDVRATSAADIAVPVIALQDRALLVNVAYTTVRSAQVDAAREPNQQALYLLLGFWAYNIFDLVYFEPEQPGTNVSLRAEIGPDFRMASASGFESAVPGARLAVGLRFNF